MSEQGKRSETRIAFRVDGGGDVGFGHVSRCASLAKAFSRHVHNPVIEFWSREIPGLDYFLGREGFSYNRIEMPEDPERTFADVESFSPHILVMDLAEHVPDYAFERWTVITRKYAGNLARLAPVTLQIDDFAQGVFDTDFVLNSGVAPEYTTYEDQGNTRLLLGPEYVLLRPEFARVRNTIRQIEEAVRKVLIIDSGHRFSRVVPRMVLAIEQHVPDPDVMLVSQLYSSNPNRMNSSLEILCVPAVQDMAGAMLDADLVIAGGGTILHELAACGAPAVSLPAIDLQVKNAERFEQLGTLRQLGFKPSFETINEVIGAVVKDRELRRSMMDKGRALVDGMGADRVAQKLLGRLDAADV